MSKTLSCIRQEKLPASNWLLRSLKIIALEHSAGRADVDVDVVACGRNSIIRWTEIADRRGFGDRGHREGQKYRHSR